jgi:hypothetical protein
MFTNIRNLALDKKMKVPWPKEVALQLDPKKKGRARRICKAHTEKELY